MEMISTAHLIEAIAWLGSALTIATYAMNTMVPLRVLAMVSNLCFLIYALILQLWPLVVMDLILLPINGYRLFQILTLRRRLTKVSGDMEPDFSVVKTYGKKRRIPVDTIVFQRGDPVGSLYFLAEGRIKVEDFDIELAENSIFGEIAFFTEAATRTSTVRCLDEVLVYELDRKAFMRLQFEHPSFGLAVMRTVARRLTENAISSMQLETGRPIPS